MQINQLKHNSKLTILIKQSGKQIQLETTCLELRDPSVVRAFSQYIEKGYVFVVTKPILSGGKAVGFPASKTIQYQAIGVINNQPYIWSDIHVKMVSFANGQKFHLIYSAQNPLPSERRSAVRYAPHANGSATVGLGKMGYPVVLENLSISGMAITFPAEVPVEKGKLIHLEFTDEGTTFRVAGLVLRVDSTPKGNVVACKMTQTGSAVIQYINRNTRPAM